MSLPCHMRAVEKGNKKTKINKLKNPMKYLIIVFNIFQYL